MIFDVVTKFLTKFLSGVFISFCQVYGAWGIYHEFHESCHSVIFIVVVNSHQRWKQTRFRVCFHLWCELTTTMNITEWQVSWNSWIWETNIVPTVFIFVKVGVFQVMLQSVIRIAAGGVQYTASTFQTNRKNPQEIIAHNFPLAVLLLVCFCGPFFFMDFNSSINLSIWHAWSFDVCTED